MSDASDAKARDAAERVVAVCDVLAQLAQTDLTSFVDDIRTQWAVEMGLIRIGEAVNRIPADVLQRFPDQPWPLMVAMRNFAAHQYDDLDPRRVWRTLTSDVPALRTYLVETVLPGLA
ncbi:hypothetical protein ASE01_15530 [Nocardioides sp. Root190]|uniref:HepT-like ribonuclease domain-containing protein n=1 Tax=Nocardioides sp. Root190 TaxID=1736488 RepID=UPI00070103C7|nr:HepT-like ribonuclease domain-containing protein [Nocardioides sp. Root190]KRB76392.1 hypothetical protein ASE01_15530 [Nocardioides sp. Root190]